MTIENLDSNNRADLIELAKRELHYEEMRKDLGRVHADNIIDGWVRGHLHGKTVGTVSIDISDSNKPIAAGAQLILAERNKQLLKGRSIENDVAGNTENQLLIAIRVLLWGPSVKDSQIEYAENQLKPINWDKAIWSKMIRKGFEKRLVIAGALIAAEIDRIRNS